MAKYEITYVDGSKEVGVVEVDGYTNKNEWVAITVVGDSQKVIIRASTINKIVSLDTK